MFLHTISDALVSHKSIETLFSKVVSRRRNEGLCEHRECWGDDYPNMTFYVIRRPSMWGLMSILAVYINHINYAIRRGYIPVIDQCTVTNLYLEEDELNTGINSWEYYFEQPAGYSLEDIAHAHNVVLSGMLLWSSDENSYRINYETVSAPFGDKWQRLAQGYYRKNRQASEHIARISRSVLQSRGNVTLGVYCRGTDYVDMHPKGHPVQPTAEQVIDKARQVLSERSYQYVYLVTEDDRVWHKFRDAFGDRLLYIDAARYGDAKDDGSFIWQRKNPRDDSKYTSGLDYLTGMSLLHECDGLVAGITGGTAGLRLLQQRPFGYEHYWNLGIYT